MKFTCKSNNYYGIDIILFEIMSQPELVKDPKCMLFFFLLFLKECEIMWRLFEKWVFIHYLILE